jgi:hypothetical protein
MTATAGKFGHPSTSIVVGCAGLNSSGCNRAWRFKFDYFSYVMNFCFQAFATTWYSPDVRRSWHRGTCRFRGSDQDVDSLTFIGEGAVKSS